MFSKSRALSTALATSMILGFTEAQTGAPLSMVKNSCTNTCSGGAYFYNTLGNGPNCSCCPIWDPCSKVYGNTFCDANGNLIPGAVPQGCPQRQIAGCPTACAQGLFQNPNCDCCPDLFTACLDVVYPGLTSPQSYFLGKYCDWTSQTVNLINVPATCPNKPVVSTSCVACTSTNFIQSQTCDCCPQQGKECDVMYSGAFCKADGKTTDFNKIPSSCVQNFVTPLNNNCPKNFYPSQYGECCPVPGTECSQDNIKAGFCIPGAQGKPQQINIQQLPFTCTGQPFFLGQSYIQPPNALCDSTLCDQTKNIFMTAATFDTVKNTMTGPPTCSCCPLSGMECNASAYGTKYCPDGITLDYTLMPKDCPQYTFASPAIRAYYESMINSYAHMSSPCKQKFSYYATNGDFSKVQCCPVPGHECDSQFNNQYCDFNGNFIQTAFGICSIPILLQAQIAQNSIPTNTAAAPIVLKNDCTNTCDTGMIPFGNDPSCVCCPNPTDLCNSVYKGTYCDSNGAWIVTNIPTGCPSPKNAKCATGCTQVGTIQNAQCACCPVPTTECAFNAFQSVWKGIYCPVWYQPYQKVMDPTSTNQTSFQPQCYYQLYSSYNYIQPGQLICPTGATCDTSLNGEVCPKAGLECDAQYNGIFCTNGVMDNMKIPTSCAQNYFYPLKNKCQASYYPSYAGECCPIPVPYVAGSNYSTPDFSQLPTTCPGYDAKLAAQKLAETNSATLTADQLVEKTKNTIYFSLQSLNNNQWANIYCPQYFLPSGKGQCCPVPGIECDSKYNNYFCTPVDPSASPIVYKLLIGTIPLTCPQHAAVIGKECPIDCQNDSMLRTPQCDCCPNIGSECDPSFNGKYCDKNGNIILTSIPASCPQQKPAQSQGIQNNCPQNCDVGFIPLGAKCQCCPNPSDICNPAYKNQYCDAATNKWIPANIPQGCPTPKLNTCPNTCDDGFFQNPACGCCPLPGFECIDSPLQNIYQGRFCQQNKPTFQGNDQSDPKFSKCILKNVAQAFWTNGALNMMQTNTYQEISVFGIFCPKQGTECLSCDPITGPASYCCIAQHANAAAPSQITGYGFSYDNIDSSCIQNSLIPLTQNCGPLQYPSYAGECCPILGTECFAQNLDKGYCDMLGNLIYQQFPTTCPQYLINQQKSQSMVCPNQCTGDYTLSDSCDCCPLQGQECNIFKYGTKYCSTGVVNYSLIPTSCPSAQIKCNNLCPAGFEQSPFCDCCPYQGRECIDKDFYGNQFCINGQLIFSNFAPTCPQAQMFNTCPNQCANSFFQTQACECCPNQGYECDPIYGGKYCNADGTLNIAGFVDANGNPTKSCPQLQVDPTKCPAAAACTGSNPIQTNVCECCPSSKIDCADKTLTLALKTQYCNADGSINYDAFAQSCDQYIQRPKKTCATPCLANFVQDEYTCDCCPLIGKECDDDLYPSLLFCSAVSSTTQVALDLTKIPKSCPQQFSSPICQGTMCPSQYIVGDNCDCCPQPGRECDKMYGGLYCTGSVLNIASIPQGCPSKDNFLHCQTPSNPLKFFSNLCEQCPVQGHETDKQYNGAFSTPDGKINIKSIPYSCPQWQELSYFCTSDCDANYKQGTLCSCCPIPGQEGDISYYISGLNPYVDSNGSVILSNIPADCPQHNKLKVVCDEAKDTENDAKVSKYINLFVTPECEVCPIPGQECQSQVTGLFDDEFCINGSVNYFILPASCPQNIGGSKGCDLSLYSQLPSGECCPISGQECDARYQGRFCDLSGNILFMNIPESCPNFQSKSTCPPCEQNFIQLSDCSCCPFPGQECSYPERFGYCDATGMVNLFNIPVTCPQIKNPVCNPNYYWTAMDLSTPVCCPFVGHECDPVYQDKYCPIDLGTQKNGQLNKNLIPAICISQLNQKTCGIQCNSLHTAGSVCGDCCPQVGHECDAIYDGKYCQLTVFGTNMIQYQNIPQSCPQNQQQCPPIMRLSQSGKCCPIAGTECNTDLFGAAFCTITSPSIIPVIDLNKFTSLGYTDCPQQAVQPCTTSCTSQNLFQTASCDCCPIPGTECDATKFPAVTTNNVSGASLYCPTNPGIIDITTIPASCPQVTSQCTTTLGANMNYAAGSCDQCPIVGRECDTAIYPSQPSWCDNDNKIILQNIPVTCPQRARDQNTCIATMFTYDTVKGLCCPFSGQECTSMYGGANGVYCTGNAIDPTKIGACLVSPPIVCPTQCANGLIQTATCDCCPALDQECSPAFGNKYCTKSGQIILTNIPASCPQYPKTFNCPSKFVTCGDTTQYEMSADCQCCQKQSTGLNLLQIPMSCPIQSTSTKCSPHDYFTTNVGECCPYLGTESDTKFSNYYLTTDGILDPTKFPASCPQSKIKTACPLSSECDSSKLQTSACECCPIVNHECDTTYGDEFCEADGTFKINAFPASCPQLINPCPPSFFKQKESGSCCPISNEECYPVYSFNFCQNNGQFIKNMFDNCGGVPKCSQSCDDGYAQNGCTCCPIPGFELDPLYNGAFTDSNGNPVKSDACTTFDIFSIKSKPAASFYLLNFYQDNVVNATLANQTMGYNPLFIMMQPLVTQQPVNLVDEKPAFDLKTLQNLGIDQTINFDTQGRVDSIQAINHIAKYALNVQIQNLGAQLVSAMKSGTAYPTNLLDILAFSHKQILTTDWLGLPSQTQLLDVLLLGYGNQWFPSSRFTVDAILDFGYYSQVSSSVLQQQNIEFTASAALGYMLWTGTMTFDDQNYLSEKVPVTVDLTKLSYMQQVFMMIQFKVADGIIKLSPKPSGYSDQDMLDYNVYFYDQVVFPGLQETSSVNSYRATFFAALKAQAVKGDSIAHQSDLDKVAMNQIGLQMNASPVFNPYQRPLQYSQADIDLYGLTLFTTVIDSTGMNNILDTAKNQITAGIFNNDYATNVGLWATTAKPLLDFVGKKTTDISTHARLLSTVFSGGISQFTAEQMAGYIALQLFLAEKQVSDFVIPTYTQAILDQYGLTQATIDAFNYTPIDITTIMKQNNNPMWCPTGFLNYPQLDDQYLAKFASQPKNYQCGMITIQLYNMRPPAEAPINEGVYMIDIALFDDYQLAQLKISRQQINNGKSSWLDAYFTMNTLGCTQTLSTLPSYASLAGFNANGTLTSGSNNSNDTQLACQDYAALITSATLGFYPRLLNELNSYFVNPGIVIQQSRLSESDLINIDANYNKFGLDTNKVFQYTQANITAIGFVNGLNPPASTAALQKMCYAWFVYQTNLAQRQNLYQQTSLTDYFANFGYTDALIQQWTKMSIQQIKDNQLNSEQVAEIIFQAKYGPKCPTPYATGCTTGEANKDFQFAAASAGLTRYLWESREMSLFEVMQIVEDYKMFTHPDSRTTLSFSDLYKNHKDRLAVFTFATPAWLVKNGQVCFSDLAQSDQAGLSTADDPSFIGIDGVNPVNYCQQFTSQNSPYSRTTALTNDLIAPQTNVDLLRSVISRAQFQAFIDYNVVAGAATTMASQTDPIWAYDGFEAAVAMIPSFCSVTDTRTACQKQVAAFMAVTRSLTGNFRSNPNSATCSPASDNTCQHLPPIESLEFHWIANVLNAVQANVATVSYRPRGTGMITGPGQYWRFFNNMHDTKEAVALFASPDGINTDATVFWLTGLWRFMSPVYHSVTSMFTESQSPLGTWHGNFEDSYLTPSPNSWLRNYDASQDTNAQTAFGGKDNGFVGVIKSYFPVDCKGAASTALAQQVADDFTYYSNQVNGPANSGVAPWIADATQQNTCSQVVGAFEIPFMNSFNGKNYFSSQAVTEDGQFQKNIFNPQFGTCYNIYMETPYSVYSNGGYADCQALSTALVFSNYLPGVQINAATDFLAAASQIQFPAF